MFRHRFFLRAKPALRFLLILAFMSFSVLLFSSPVTAATLTLKPEPEASQDVWVSSNSPDYNYENNGIMRVGNETDPEYTITAYILIGFDLTDLPTTVTSAVLQLVLYEMTDAPFAIGAHRINSAWEADTVTWNTLPTYEVTPAATTTGAAPESVWEWDVTALYNSWQSGTPNYGVLLQSALESPDAGLGFCEAMGETPPEWYPRLVLTYDETVTYTVTFDSVGGSAVSPAVVPSDGLVTKPTDPVLAGNEMDGWFREATYETEWLFATDMVEGDITLYAKWTPLATPTPTFTPTPTPTVAPTPTPTPTPVVIPDTGEHSLGSLPIGVSALLLGEVSLAIARRRVSKRRSQ